jgi:alkaline phosphatase D
MLPHPPRRDFLRQLGGGVLLASAGALSVPLWANPRFGSNPFTLGVASGDPAPDGFVIWTKLAPKPLEPGGGVGERSLEVAWSVATDERMGKVVRKGTFRTGPDAGHAVHVEIEGLEPARDYFYRFSAGGEASATGRARTLPAAGSAVSQLRFAVAGCQRYEDGYYTAYGHLAREHFDFVFHYGDYIYERSAAHARQHRKVLTREMPGDPGECITLEDYRNRYSIYQLDPDLQAAQASTPFVLSFDDHEVRDNWAGAKVGNLSHAQAMARRAAAFQAWYEHLPLRRAQRPTGPDIQAYRRFQAGNLLGMDVLDTRQYRSPQACGAPNAVECAEARDPQRSLLGEAQERWLHEGFRNRVTRWNAIAQQVPVMRFDRNPDPEVLEVSMDKWDGYAPTRDRMFAAAEAAKLSNLVVLTGDVHVNMAAELKKDFADARSPVLGVEFVATSISSNGDGFDTGKRQQAALQHNPHIRFHNAQRGYVSNVVTPGQWRTDYRVLDKITSRGGQISTRKSFTVEYGNPGLHET